MVVRRVGEQVGFRLDDKARLLQRVPDNVRLDPVQLPVVVVRAADVVGNTQNAAGLQGLFDAEQDLESRGFAFLVLYFVHCFRIV